MAPRRDAYALSPTLLALRAAVGISGEDPESRTGWIDIAGPGEWKGHPEGPFTLDRAAFESCIAAFEAQANPIVVDYDHASMRVNPDGGAPAAGWVQKLEIRGDRLFGLVEWTPRAAAGIRNGEHRFCSGVFDFAPVDRVTGESNTVCVMDSVALTNRPFIDGQQPIALTRTVQLEIPHMADAPQTEDAGAMLAARLMEATGLDVAALLAALDANLPAVTAALKGEVKSETEVETPMAAPPAAPAAVAPAAETAALSAQVAALTAQVNAQAAELKPLREAAAKAADEALVGEVDAAVKAGKFHPSTRDEMVKLARGNPAGIRALMAATPAHMPHAPSNAPAIVPQSQAHSIDRTAKRLELTARIKSWPGLTDKQREETVERQMAALYPEGN